MTTTKTISIAVAVTLAAYTVPKYCWPIVLEKARAQMGAGAREAPRGPTVSVKQKLPDPWTGVLLSPAVELTARLDGRVAKVNVRVGELVRVGDILAELDTTVQKHEIAAAEAAVRASRAETWQASVSLAQARDRQKRRGAVVHYGNTDLPIVSAEELAGSQFDALAASSRVSSAAAATQERAARLAQLRAQVDEATVRAPFDGIIATRYLEPGAHVRSGMSLVRLVGRGGLRVRFAVPENEGSSVQMASKVAVDCDGRSLEGTVDRIAPEVESASGTIFVEASVAAAESDHTALAGRVVAVRPTPSR